MNYFPVIFFLLIAGSIFAEAPDTTRNYRIREIEVRESARKAELQSLTPLQIVGTRKLESLSVLELSDVVKFMSGATLKDYGGIGGLKTVSVRSLGAGHTAVNIDGVVVSNVLTGQIDLGKYSLEQVGSISLNQGQSANLFQPARNFASASVLNIYSARPYLEADKPIQGGMKLRMGSFGLLNPSFWMHSRLSKRWTSSVSLEFLKSIGDYPYKMVLGSSAGDSTSTERRSNADVSNFRAQIDLFASLPRGFQLESRQYFQDSDRGLPGATLFYSSQNQAAQRLKERNMHTQGKLSKAVSDKFRFALLWKLSGNQMEYTDPDFPNSSGGISDSYTQEEYYLSNNLYWEPAGDWSLSWSNDLFYTGMHTSIPDYIRPERFSWLSFLGTKYQKSWLDVQASLLSTLAGETAYESRNFRQLSPYAGISFHPEFLNGLNFRFFYKDIYRLPTFNDMYYPMMGNKDLRPEKASQYNLGVSWSKRISDLVPELSLTADAYSNRVRDKIVAFPNKSSFSWTILNFGQVDIKGLDMSWDMIVATGSDLKWELGGNYSYMRSLDRTDPESASYGNQIPYTPRVSGSATLMLITPWFNAGSSLIWSGHRYVLPENYAENRLAGYKDISLNIDRKFQFSNYEGKARIEILNLLNENYSVIRWFPMPGRNYRFSLSLKF